MRLAGEFMRNKIVSVGAVVGLLLLCLFIGRYTDPKKIRVEQHKTYNTELLDTNLSIDPETFTSKLPVVEIETGGAVIPGKKEHGKDNVIDRDAYLKARIRIYDQDGQLNSLKDTAVIDSDIGIHVRGESSRYFDKSSYRIKFYGEGETAADYAVMGMEKANAWVLYGPSLDKTLKRNYMWYNLAGQIMEWAPDVRYCEVFLNGSYQGLYVMVEAVSVGEGRIQIKKTEDGMKSTSYIIRSDRGSENPLSRIRNFTYYVYRKLREMDIEYPGKKKLTPEIEDYIEKDFSKFEKALYSFDYDTKLYGYENFIDVDSFIDYFIINEFTKNNDAGLYSTYFYKDVSGKLKMCVWDFNNCCDNYMEEISSSRSFNLVRGVWFEMLLKDEKFTEKIISRYRELRKGVLSDSNLIAYIENIDQYLGAAVDRNYQVWGYMFEPSFDLLGPSRAIGAFQEANEQYKNFLIKRARWIDDNIEILRYYCHESLNKKFNH